MKFKKLFLVFFIWISFFSVNAEENRKNYSENELNKGIDGCKNILKHYGESEYDKCIDLGGYDNYIKNNKKIHFRLPHLKNPFKRKSNEQKILDNFGSSF